MDLALGKKRRCNNCSTVFFDMCQNKPRCPKCAAIFVFCTGSFKGLKQKSGLKDKLSKKDDAEMPDRDAIDVMNDDVYDDAGIDMEVMETINNND